VEKHHISVSVTSLTMKHPLLDFRCLKIFLKKERKENPATMFEEFSTGAGQTIVVLFWLFLAMIFIWGLAWSRTQIKGKS